MAGAVSIATTLRIHTLERLVHILAVSRDFYLLQRVLTAVWGNEDFPQGVNHPRREADS